MRNDPGERHNLWAGDERNVSQFIATLVKKNVVRDRRP
jgi:hypothetical protein